MTSYRRRSTADQAREMILHDVASDEESDRGSLNGQASEAENVDSNDSEDQINDEIVGESGDRFGFYKVY